MANVEELRISGWKELNELVYGGSWSPEFRRHRSTSAFRGMGDAAADLRTGLVRLGGASDRLEGHLLRNFRKYAERQSVPRGSIWNCSRARSTTGRLLDWTYSPYVAMHVATIDVTISPRDA